MNNKHVPYFNFYPADFMNGVRGMSAQDVGVYTMLLCRIYEESGPVEFNILRLSTYCGLRAAVFEKTVQRLVDLGKFTVLGGVLRNPRAEVEIHKRAHGLKMASRAGKASAEKRQQKQSKPPTDVESPFNHTDTDTEVRTEANASADEAVGEGQADDFAKQVFDRAVTYLGKHGIKESQARSFVGKCRKDYADVYIFQAFTDCAKSGAVDPIPWIAARLKPPDAVDLKKIMAGINPDGTLKNELPTT